MKAESISHRGSLGMQLLYASTMNGNRKRPPEGGLFHNKPTRLLLAAVISQSKEASADHGVGGRFRNRPRGGRGTRAGADHPCAKNAEVIELHFIAIELSEA